MFEADSTGTAGSCLAADNAVLVQLFYVSSSRNTAFIVGLYRDDSKSCGIIQDRSVHSVIDQNTAATDSDTISEVMSDLFTLLTRLDVQCNFIQHLQC